MDLGKRIDQAIKNKAQSNKETEREFTGLELLCLILRSLFSATAGGVLGEEFEEFGMKEKEVNTV